MGDAGSPYLRLVEGGLDALEAVGLQVLVQQQEQKLLTPRGGHAEFWVFPCGKPPSEWSPELITSCKDLVKLIVAPYWKCVAAGGITDPCVAVVAATIGEQALAVAILLAQLPPL